LSFLAFAGGVRVLAMRLGALGFRPGDSVKKWTMENFSLDMVRIIHEVYEKFAHIDLRADAFRIFDTIGGLEELADAGWIIANHSAAHYPTTEVQGKDFFLT